MQPSVSLNPSSPSQGHVLLAEAYKPLQQILTHYLMHTGQLVEIVDNGRDAVANALAGDHGLIFMNLDLPELDGLAATRLLREQGFSKPIVAIGGDRPDDLERCRQAGCNGILLQPVQRNQLLKILVDCQLSRSAASITPRPSDLGDQVEFLPLICDYVRRLGPLRDAMRIALDDGNWADLQRYAHQVKGSGGMYGYPDLTEVMGRLQDACIEGPSSERLNDLFNEANQLIDRIRAGCVDG